MIRLIEVWGLGNLMDDIPEEANGNLILFIILFTIVIIMFKVHYVTDRSSGREWHRIFGLVPSHSGIKEKRFLIRLRELIKAPEGG